MSVAAQEIGPAATGGDAGPVEARTPGVRPRAGRVCATPRLARRMDHRPGPRLRLLHPVRAAPAPPPASEPGPEPGPPDRDLTTPAWVAALDAARSQVGPVALRVLAAVAEVLDGVRPVEHLAGVCAADVAEEVGAHVLAARRPGTRGTRVRGLRMCPLVTTGPHPVPAVEVAAALCGPGRPDPSSAPGRLRPAVGRARAVAGRFELYDDGWRLVALVIG